MKKQNEKHESKPDYQSYWIKKLSGDLPPVDLPNIKLRPNVKSNNHQAFRTFFSKPETDILHNFVLNEEKSTFPCLLAAWNILFYRYTSQRDIILGTRIIDKNDSNLENQFDFYDNTILLRAALEPSENFNSFYNRIKKSQLLDHENQPYSIDQIVTDLSIIADKGRNAIFDIRITFNKTETKYEGFDNSLNISNNRIDFGENASKLDLEISFQEIAGILCFDILYNTDVYERDMIESMTIHFKTLLFELITQPTVNVEEINYISDQEHNLLLNVFNKPEIEYPKDKTIVDLFSEQVKKTPEGIAVVFNQQKLTYLELDILSNQLANYLISKHNIISGDLVGIMLGRSEMLIVCIIGVLKTRSAYVPMDPEYPKQRISYIQNDSKCKVTLDSNLFDNFFRDKEVFSTQPPKNVSLNPDSLSYIIYTSGTTGNPKGVMIEHKNVVRLFYNKSQLFDFNENDVWSLFHSFCFDFSIWEIFGALLFGGKLIVVPEMIAKDPFEFITLIVEEGITILNQTPSSFINFMSNVNNKDINLKLRYIIFGGEALYPKCLEKWFYQFPNIKFINMYGITETTVHVTYKEIKEFDIQSNISNIGKCIPTLSAYIVNDFQKLQPIGIIGELCVSGLGLARGYLHKPELTSNKFVANPFEEGERMYLTGDLARWLPDGNIEYMGRKDDQVKIRGHRIELGEIEAALGKLPNIKRATVLVSNHLQEEPRLVAYIQSKEFDEDVKIIRNQLTEILPEFMIPSFFMWVNDFPITTNGKIDKNKLPLPEYVRQNSEANLRKPRTKTEEEIAKVWSEVLQIEEIGIDDNFFEMGGTSIMAVKVVAEIEKSTGKRFPLSVLFEYSTVEKFAKLLNEGGEIYSDCIVPLKSSGSKVPLFMVHGGGLDVLYFANVSKHLDEEQPFYGIQGVGAKGFDEWYESIDDMAAHYIQAITKINPNGPYALAGYCVGGIIAFEMTRQLQDQGKEVSLTVLLDSYADSSYYYKSYKQKKLIKHYHRTQRRLIFLKEMLTSWKAFKNRFNAKKEYIIKKHFNDSTTMSELDALALERFTQSVTMMSGILNKYHLKPQSLKVDVFRSKDNAAHLLAPKHLGWKKAARKGVTISEIPVSDFDMRKAPHDKILARMLQDILDERHAGI